MKKLFYILTAWFPRRMPTTEKEFKQLKLLLTKIFHIPSDEKTWIIIASHIESIKPPSCRISHWFIVKMVRRFYINQLLHDIKIKHYAVIDKQTQEAEEAKKKIEKIEKIEPGVTIV